VREISGWESVETVVGGINQWDEEWVYSGGAVRSANRIPLQPNTTYFFIAPTGSEWANVYCKDADGNTTVLGNPGYPFTTTSDTVYGTIATGGAYGTTYKNDISINYPSTDHDYHAYVGTTHTTDLGQTVYGGTVDVVSGTLKAYPYYASYNGETLDGEWICDRAVYSQGTTPPIGSQVVLISGESTTYTLTPQQINTLAGVNNVWVDSGDCSITYYADTKLYIDKKLGGN
jgi:hypothetical protein